MKQSDQINELAAALSKAQSEGNVLAESKLIPKILKITSPVKRLTRFTKLTTEQRFRMKTATGFSNCIYWRAATHRDGYGSFDNDKAHRASFRLFKGAIPKNMEVMHTCDIRNCVNPDHLILGTHAQNMKDAAKKKRMKPQLGEKNKFAKLSEENILTIRNMINNGTHFKKIAALFNISLTHVYYIKDRAVWKHI